VASVLRSRAAVVGELFEDLAVDLVDELSAGLFTAQRDDLPHAVDQLNV